MDVIWFIYGSNLLSELCYVIVFRIGLKLVVCAMCPVLYGYDSVVLCCLCSMLWAWVVAWICVFR